MFRPHNPTRATHLDTNSVSKRVAFCSFRSISPLECGNFLLEVMVQCWEELCVPLLRSHPIFPFALRFLPAEFYMLEPRWVVRQRPSDVFSSVFPPTAIAPSNSDPTLPSVCLSSQVQFGSRPLLELWFGNSTRSYFASLYNSGREEVASRFSLPANTSPLPTLPARNLGQSTLLLIF